jgi:hypothetical protein
VLVIITDMICIVVIYVRTTMNYPLSDFRGYCFGRILHLTVGSHYDPYNILLRNHAGIESGQSV